MSPSASDDRAGAAAHLAIALIFAAIALSLAWLQVEGVINLVVLRAVELYVG